MQPRNLCAAGLSYWQISDQTTAGTFDRTACLWFSMSVVTLQPSANAVSIFNQEREVLRRELSNGEAPPAMWLLYSWDWYAGLHALMHAENHSVHAPMHVLLALHGQDCCIISCVYERSNRSCAMWTAHQSNVF